MTLAEFRQSDGSGLQGALLALWHADHGEWEHAHEIAQDLPEPEGAWVHAYLHRAEGDTGNAAYWYRRANRPIVTGDLHAEWERIVEELLGR